MQKQSNHITCWTIFNIEKNWPFPRTESGGETRSKQSAQAQAYGIIRTSLECDASRSGLVIGALSTRMIKAVSERQNERHSLFANSRKMIKTKTKTATSAKKRNVKIFRARERQQRTQIFSMTDVKFINFSRHLFMFDFSISFFSLFWSTQKSVRECQASILNLYFIFFPLVICGGGGGSCCSVYNFKQRLCHRHRRRQSINKIKLIFPNGLHVFLVFAQIFDFHARLEKPMLLNCRGHNMHICNAISMQCYALIYLFAEPKWEKSDARLNYWFMVMSVFVCIKLDLRYKMSTMRYEVIIFGLRAM